MLTLGCPTRSYQVAYTTWRTTLALSRLALGQTVNGRSRSFRELGGRVETTLVAHTQQLRVSDLTTHV